MMERRFGAQRAYELSEIMNHRAPLTLRVNPLKVSREDVPSVVTAVDSEVEGGVAGAD